MLEEVDTEAFTPSRFRTGTSRLVWIGLAVSHSRGESTRIRAIRNLTTQICNSDVS